MLRARQGIELKFGNFGGGYPYEPIDEPQIDSPINANSTADMVKEHIQSNDDNFETFADKLISKVRNLADAMLDMLTII